MTSLQILSILLHYAQAKIINANLLSRHLAIYFLKKANEDKMSCFEIMFIKNDSPYSPTLDRAMFILMSESVISIDDMYYGCINYIVDQEKLNLFLPEKEEINKFLLDFKGLEIINGLCT